MTSIELNLFHFAERYSAVFDLRVLEKMVLNYLSTLLENNVKSSGEDVMSAIVPLMKLISLTIIKLISG